MTDEKVKDEVTQMMGMFEVLPKLVVFDLDYTLWPFYCECRSKREMPSLYPHAKGILSALKEKGVDMAIASRSPTPDIANTFLDKLNIKSMFIARLSSLIFRCLLAWMLSFWLGQEIYSSWSHKTEHFQRIHTRTGVPFSSILFFDDEERNTKAVSKMGVTSILVGNGVTLGAFRQGLTQFSQNHNAIEKNKQRWRTKFSKTTVSSETDRANDV